MPSTSRSQAIHDPRILRAIAHPVRNRILTELGATGSMRAADLARELDLPANQMSFHLRQLAKYGLVEEDPGAGRDRRDRVWRPTADGGVSFDLTSLQQQPGGAAAAAIFRRNAAGWAHLVVDAAYDERHDPTGVRIVNESAVRLTREEAEEMAAELDEVRARWVERTRGRDPERRTYLWFAVLQPHPDLHGASDASGDRGTEDDGTGD